MAPRKSSARHRSEGAPHISNREILALLREAPKTFAGLCKILKVRGKHKKDLKKALMSLMRKDQIQLDRRHHWRLATPDGPSRARVEPAPADGLEHWIAQVEDVGRHRVRIRPWFQKGRQIAVLPKKKLPRNSSIKEPWARVLAKPRDRGFDIESISPFPKDPARNVDEIVAHQFGLSESFSPSAESDAQRLHDEHAYSKEDKRADLRLLPFVTIDGADAKDFDDAVCVDDNDCLWVAIADVSHYVRPNTPLDVEASERGNSFYFPNKVFPMLPEALSNGICSLRPDAVRRAAVMCFQKQSTSKAAPFVLKRIERAWIQSKARLTYAEVESVLQKPQQAKSPWTPMLLKLQDIASSLRLDRMNAGALDIQPTERRIRLNKNGSIEDIYRRKGLTSENLIEELMLLANRSIAKHVLEKDIKALFRAHPKLQSDRWSSFLSLMQRYFPKHRVLSMDLSSALSILKEDPNGDIFGLHALRTLERARYTPESSPHYGLAFDHYLHFTSPIRRYADLICHRLLFEKDDPVETLVPKRFGTLTTLATHLNVQERMAQLSEWRYFDIQSSFLAERMVGQTFQARVTSVVAKGFFVQVARPCLEGFVHLKNLPHDRYDVRLESQEILSQRHPDRNIFLGKTIDVDLASADLSKLRIDFRPAQGKRSKT